MYIVGHLLITEKSGAFAPGEPIYSESALTIMLPDYVRCHDWGYRQCFTRNHLSRDGLLIRAHMLGDWFMHYGEISAEPKKVGWAYRRMGIYARRYHEFFSEAARRGLREDVPPADSVRGFSHTMMEFTLDTFLVEQGLFDSRFKSVQGALGVLGLTDGLGSQQWIDKTIKSEEIFSSSSNITADVTSYRERVQKAKNPSEFAYRAGVRKFGLCPCDESIALVRRFIRDGLREVSSQELSEVFHECSEFLRKWLLRTVAEGE